MEHLFILVCPDHDQVEQTGQPPRMGFFSRGLEMNHNLLENLVLAARGEVLQNRGPATLQEKGPGSRHERLSEMAYEAPTSW